MEPGSRSTPAKAQDALEERDVGKMRLQLLREAAAVYPQMDGIIEDTEFTENIKITFTLPHGADGEFNRKLADLSNGSMQAEAVGVRFAGEPVTK